MQGIIVVNTECIPMKNTKDNPTTMQYASLMHNFAWLHLETPEHRHETDPQKDLTFLLIHAKKNEIMIVPDKDYFLILVQNTSG